MFILLLLFHLFPPLEKEHIIADGYVDKLSAYAGDSLTVYVNAREKDNQYLLKLYNLKGDVVAKYITAVFPQEQNKNEPWKNGFGYKATLHIKVPALKSGVYLWDDQIPFIVKARNPKIVVVYSSNTENAYCNAGGKGLYSFNSSDRIPATTVSFLRPIPLPKHSEAFLRWFCKQKIADVGYIIDRDLDQYGEWKNAKLLMIVGHSEYWTRQGRTNFDRFVNEGKSALVLSGNTMWWQVRYDLKQDQLICYKTEPDPEVSPCLKTVNWDNPVLDYSILSSIGAEFPRAGYGQKQDRGWDGYKISTPQSPLLKGLHLRQGDIIPLASDESDGAPILAFSKRFAPEIDRKLLGFEKIELVAYDSTYRIKDGLATWIVFQKNKNSGIIINTASTDWCSQRGMDQSDIKKITLTMIQLLVKKENVFTVKN